MSRAVWRRLRRGFSYAVLAAAAGRIAADCTLTSTGNTPLPDRGAGLYQGASGGLYPNGSSARPGAHEAAGMKIAVNQILPRNAAGAVDLAAGKIVLISVGMSNTTQEFASAGSGAFKPRADADPSKNPQLVIVDGAQGGQDAARWLDPNATTWANVDSRLSAAGVTPQQVQVAWVKQALIQPSTLGAFPAHALTLQSDNETIARNLLIRYPNIKIAYFSSRTRAYTNVVTSLNPEPFAFESAFSVKWMIQNQIQGLGNLSYDSAAGTVVAPWLSWGPYLWADGTTPRSDGFTWLCADTQADFTHPSAASGVPKVADQLLAFFKTDPTARRWFLRRTVVGQPPTLTASAAMPAAGGPVQFSATASDPDGTIAGYAWTFEDGTFSLSQNPAKSFPAPGTYRARVTVTDNSGNAVSRELPIAVAAETVLGVSPSSGTAAGSVPISIAGARFAAGASVQVGGLPASGVSVPSAGRIDASTPALSPGTLNDVAVANPTTTPAVLPRAFFADFSDVAQGDTQHAWVEKMVRNAVTAGCGGGNYCPTFPVTRAHMAPFLLVAKETSDYAPAAATGVFADVPVSSPFAKWIEELARRGVTAGCGGGNYCPADPVTRAQMAVFLLVTKDGSSYSPPPAAGLFADVPVSSPFARWIEELYRRGITAGCGGGNYCPNNPVTRGQMAVFLVSNFGLP